MKWYTLQILIPFPERIFKQWRQQFDKRNAKHKDHVCMFKITMETSGLEFMINGDDKYSSTKPANSQKNSNSILCA